MNIYVTDINPQKCAQALDDSTLVLSLEYTAGLLCSACQRLGAWNSAMHVANRTAHPLVTWVAESKNNFRWTYRYAKELFDEYRFRFGMEHQEAKFVRTCWRAFNDYPNRPFKTEMTPFMNLTPFASDRPTDKCYQQLLCERIWNDKSTWTKRSRPDFYYPMKAA